jgi:YD repeat-containing protein
MKMTYDPDGRIAETEDARGLKADYTYDPAGQMIRRMTAEGTDTYDYDQTGRMTRAVNANQVVEYGFDMRDRVASVNYPALGKAVSYAYDPAGRMVSVDYPNGVQATTRLTSSCRLRARSTRQSRILPGSFLSGLRFRTPRTGLYKQSSNY